MRKHLLICFGVFLASVHSRLYRRTDRSVLPCIMILICFVQRSSREKKKNMASPCLAGASLVG